MGYLAIQDLEFIEDADQLEDLSGGLFTQVSGSLQISPGFAGATVTSLAIGPQTATTANTFTKTKLTSFSSTTTATAMGSAWASDGTSVSQSSGKWSSSSTSINLSIR
jgi:UPF0716 family protein affecting phage T7 exclusion